MTDVKTHYKIYNDKLLIIIMSFKYWHYYLNDSQHLIKIFINYNNLWYFMGKARLNDCQNQWFTMLALYNFVIAHQFSIHNSVNGPFCQPNYEQSWKKNKLSLYIATEIPQFIYRSSTSAWSITANYTEYIWALPCLYIDASVPPSQKRGTGWN